MRKKIGCLLTALIIIGVLSMGVAGVVWTFKSVDWLIYYCLYDGIVTLVLALMEVLISD